MKIIKVLSALKIRHTDGRMPGFDKKFLARSSRRLPRSWRRHTDRSNLKVLTS